MHILVEVFSKLPAKAAVMLQKLEDSQPGEVHDKKKKTHQTALTLTLALAKEINEITTQINRLCNRGSISVGGVVDPTLPTDFLLLAPNDNNPLLERPVS